jgi:hypothetical protein
VREETNPPRIACCATDRADNARCSVDDAAAAGAAAEARKFEFEFEFEFACEFEVEFEAAFEREFERAFERAGGERRARERGAAPCDAAAPLGAAVDVAEACWRREKPEAGCRA